LPDRVWIEERCEVVGSGEDVLVAEIGAKD
jgi:hypothetical protein